MVRKLSNLLMIFLRRSYFSLHDSALLLMSVLHQPILDAVYTNVGRDLLVLSPLTVAIYYPSRETDRR